MVAWDIPLVSPLEVSTTWTDSTQQRIPCLMYKHIWEIHAFEHLKVWKWEQSREARKEKSSREPQTQTYSLELTVGLSSEKEGIRLWLIIPLGRRNIPAGMGNTSCSWAQWPRQGCSTEVWPQLSSNWHLRQRNKTMKIGHVHWTSQSSSLPTLCVGLNTLPSNPRTGTTEMLFSWAKGTLGD